MKNCLIETTKGMVKGIECDAYTIFKGIPYAKPPVGELRWKAPVEIEPWEGIYNANHFANIPYQRFPKADEPVVGRYYKEFYSKPEFIPNMSENCLYLNIWTPKKTEKGKYPVAFWIHGGGFGSGYSSEIEFDGEAFCKKNVILVTIEYRLNAFGFLAHPWLSAENEKGISGNYGILDQIAALKWVYENIDAFGGDKNNITVFGQSAGSMSTQVLISSDLTENMPAKAIMQSGITCVEDVLLTPTLREEEKFGEKFVEYAGVSSLEELRAMTPEQILATKDQFDDEMFRTGIGLSMVPNVDGYVLKETVGETWKNGKMKKIPYMVGYVKNDIGISPEETKEEMPRKLTEECKRWSLQVEEVTGNPAYLYCFQHELPGDDWGAFHSSEIWYMMGTLGRCWRDMRKEDFSLSEKMITYWTDFMKTGKPSADNEEWKPYGKKSTYIKKFL